MISWCKYPFIRLLTPFAIGVLCAFSFNVVQADEKVIHFLLIFLTLLLLALIIISEQIRNYTNRWIFTVLLFLLLALLGSTFVVNANYRLKNNDISEIDDASRCYIARLHESPAHREKTLKVTLNVMAYKSDNALQSNDSKIIAYFEKDERSLNLNYGDCIILFTNPEEVEKPPNPEQFNYKDYLYKKGITHQVYLKSDAWLELNINRSNPIYRFSYWMRDFLLETMRNLGIQDEEYAVAAAILLGYDDSLPQELRQKYVAAGAMHILCVSGLHVGVIFMVFSYMLFFLDERKKNQRVAKQFILLVLIWFYALIAGLAPSILRATIMLSFLIIGNIINRNGVVLNSLAASAFILLCVNPANLFDVGFQLSYAAVIGIVTLQRPIAMLFYSKYKIINKVWEITSVTIAAQIATIPFTIYYFHQFPTYFWLSNLFMSPVSSVVIIGGMLMLLLFFIPYVNVIIAWLVSKMIHVMNYGVCWIESLPSSIIKGLYISEMQFVILLFVLLAVLLFVQLKNKTILFSIMIMSILFLLLNVNNNLKRNMQKEVIIYSINNMTAIDFIYGREHLILSDSLFINDKSAFSYNVENCLVSRGVFHNGNNQFLKDDFDCDFVKKRKNVVTFDEKLIGLSDGSVFSKEDLQYKIPLDYMVVYGRRKQTLSYILNIYEFDFLIIDGSVPYYLASKLMDEADVRFENTEVQVILSGSEEAGLRGAKAYAKAHEKELKEIETVVVACDTMRDLKDMAVYDRDLSGTLKHDKQVKELVKKAALNCGYDIPYASIYLGACDAAAFTQKGIKATGFAAMDPTPPRYYHTRLDAPDMLVPEALKVGAEVLLETAFLYDAEGLK